MDYSYKCFLYQEFFGTLDVLKMVVRSSAYWYDMLIHVNTTVKIIPRLFTDILEAIEDAPIGNAGVLKDLIQCGTAKYIIQRWK